MRALICGMLITATLQLTATTIAMACSCMAPPPVAEALAAADIVMTCRVVQASVPPPRARSEVDTTRIISSDDMVRYTLLPLASWKGAIADTMVIYSARNLISCGFEMAVGSEYLLFVRAHREFPRKRERDARIVWAGGRPSGAIWEVGLCDRNKSLNEASGDLAELGQAEWVREGQ